MPQKIRLKPGERIAGTVIVTPPKDAEVCTSELIQIISWTPRGDTLVNVGGAAVQIDLRRPTAIKLDVNVGQCDGNDIEELIREAKEKEKK